MSITATRVTPAVVKVISRSSREDEAVGVLSATMSPGHLLEFDSSGDVQRHSVRGGWAERCFVLEDALQGNDVTDAYTATTTSVDSPVRLLFGLPGDIVQCLIGTDQNITINDKLASGGDGTMMSVSTLASGLVYANTADSTAVTATTTPTNFDTNYTFPADTLRVGDVIHVIGMVDITAANSTDTLIVTFQLGPDDIYTSATLDVDANDIFYIEAWITVRTIGATGTIVGVGTTKYNAPGTAGTEWELVSTTFDTTGTLLINLEATWSSTNAGNSCIVHNFTVEVLRNNHILAVATETYDNSSGSTEALLKCRLV